eukprot:scaffold11960_cov19-Tisochrysis_lutea.AAC.9
MAQLLEDHDIQGVLQRNIPWESYMTARLISEKCRTQGGYRSIFLVPALESLSDTREGSD